MYIVDIKEQKSVRIIVAHGPVSVYNPVPLPGVFGNFLVEQFKFFDETRVELDSGERVEGRLADVPVDQFQIDREGGFFFTPEQHDEEIGQRGFDTRPLRGDGGDPGCKLGPPDQSLCMRIKVFQLKVPNWLWHVPSWASEGAGHGAGRDGQRAADRRTGRRARLGALQRAPAAHACAAAQAAQRDEARQAARAKTARSRL